LAGQIQCHVANEEGAFDSAGLWCSSVDLYDSEYDELQAWDSNFISNDAIGERVIPMTAFLKRAYMAQVNKLKAAQAPTASSSGPKPAKRAPIRPLGNGGDSTARFPKKGKSFKGEGNPTYWAQLCVLFKYTRLRFQCLIARKQLQRIKGCFWHVHFTRSD
jgi:hypothetical protein